jgi:murein L,D-transpeptidase YcbB/YkuD
MHGFQNQSPTGRCRKSDLSGEEYACRLPSGAIRVRASEQRLSRSTRAGSSNDSEIDPATIDWSTINPKAFPYRIRQEPGAGNALGYIFFPFPNNYGIYMHDTATRWLFTEGSRNFSHGCIRLQNPLDFVQKVFAGRPGFDKGRVQQVINSGQQAHYSFPEPVTLYVTYRTVTAAGDGTPVFRDDVYGRDKRVVQAMARPRS